MKNSHRTMARGTLGFGAVAALTLAAGCVVAPPPPPPPPRVVYTPPPPPPAAVDAEVQASEAPPPLPEYEQPPPPDDGYLWTPGYWAWGSGGYYWIPGTWVMPPRYGVLWTPGYWGFVGGVYLFHAGYWGPHVGFYGGVNYGYGYGGVGFEGGRWVGNSFSYNRSVTNITNVTVIHNTYNETVVNNVTVNRASFNGPGGISAQPTPQERAAAAEPHVPPTAMQRQHVQEALRNPGLAAKVNGGHPAIAATPRPAAFNAPGVVGARGAAPLARTPGATGEPAGRAQSSAAQTRSVPPPAAQPSAGQPRAAQSSAAPPRAAQSNAAQPHAAVNGAPPAAPGSHAPASKPSPAAAPSRAAPPRAAQPKAGPAKPEERKQQGDHGAH